MTISVHNRTLTLDVDADEIERRRQQMEASEHPWTPQRNRVVSKALQAYAKLATSADKGAVRAL